MLDTYETFKNDMQKFIEHAPPARQGPKGLTGFYFPVYGGEAFLCQPCASRIMGRGVNLPGGKPVWDPCPSTACVCCGNQL